MTTLSFTGDIAFSKYFKNAWKDPGFIDDKIADFLRDSDHVIANVECPLTGGDVAVDSSLTHASDPKAIAVLQHIHADIWNLANNHVLDCGVNGLLDTIHLAQDNGCAGRHTEAYDSAQTAYHRSHRISRHDITAQMTQDHGIEAERQAPDNIVGRSRNGKPDKVPHQLPFVRQNIG